MGCSRLVYHVMVIQSSLHKCRYKSKSMKENQPVINLCEMPTKDGVHVARSTKVSHMWYMLGYFNRKFVVVLEVLSLFLSSNVHGVSACK